MTFSLIALVLFAALLHATWNALLKGGPDGFWSITVMGLVTALACGPAVFFLPPPLRPSWICIAASAVLHVGYNNFLVRAYRGSDFGSAYPIARGSSPLLVTLGAALVAGEAPGLRGLAGILLVSIGIISLAFRGARLPERGVGYALATGGFIAAYSLADGIGARLSGHVLSYIAWMSLGWGLVSLPLYAVRRGGCRALWRGAGATGKAVTGGLLSLLAYGIVIFAMTRAPMGAVSALRETSVLFAVLLARLFFGEHLRARRIVSACVIVAGVLCLE